MFSSPPEKFYPARRGCHPVDGGAAAFSLLEVTLALGLAAFALTTILSMLPAGMDSLRRSMNDTASARIATSVASRIRSGESLPASGLYYFDAQGITSAQPVAGGFVAEAVVSTPTAPSTSRPFRIVVSHSQTEDVTLLQPIITREGFLVP